MPKPLWHCSLITLRSGCCTPCQTVGVASDRGKFTSLAELALHGKNSLVLSSTGNLRRWIIPHEAHAPLDYCERGFFQHCFQGTDGKQLYLASIQRFLAPLRGQVVFGCKQIARIQRRL